MKKNKSNSIIDLDPNQLVRDPRDWKGKRISTVYQSENIVGIVIEQQGLNLLVRIESRSPRFLGGRLQKDDRIIVASTRCREIKASPVVSR